MSEIETQAVSRSVDPEAISRLRSMGGEVLVEQIIELFRATATARVSAVRRGMRRGDMDRVQREARALRSSAGNVGASSICALVSELERGAAEQAAAEEWCRGIVERLERECDRVRDSLRRVRERECGNGVDNGNGNGSG